MFSVSTYAATVYQGEIRARFTNSAVMIDGKRVAFESYNINDSNYFKLRDLAQALKDSGKKFDISWDSVKNAINLLSNHSYTSVGGELAFSGNFEEKNALQTTSKIYLDGNEVALTAYNIGGSNYFKLRDVGKVSNFGVTWDANANTIRIDTATGYTEDPGSLGDQATTKNVFTPQSPISVFSKADMDYLKANFTGTKAEIAEKILQWQESNITYMADPRRAPDVSDAMRWNYFLPGIFPTGDMIREYRQGDKFYGICYQFATIYCSMASYYGIECRVTNMLEKPSELDPTIDKRTTTGLSPDEYTRLKLKLDKLGLDYSYEAIRQVASETSNHYRAEVLIDGKWVVKDATAILLNSDSNKYKFYETDWLEGYHPEKMTYNHQYPGGP